MAAQSRVFFFFMEKVVLNISKTNPDTQLRHIDSGMVSFHDSVSLLQVVSHLNMSHLNTIFAVGA